MSLLGRIFNQVNPLDNGKTFKNPQPQRPQPKPQPRVNAQQLAQAMQAQHRQNIAQRAGLGVGLAGLRSFTGLGQGISGLYDLATPGKGTNRFSKQLNTLAKNVDATAKAERINPVVYHGGQAATDLLTLLAGSAAAAATKPGQAITKGNKAIEAAMSAKTAGLAAKGVKGRVAAKTIQNIAKPGYQAANAAFTGLQAGKEASQGKKVTPQSVGINLGVGGIGFPVAGAVGSEGIKLAGQGVKALSSGAQKAGAEAMKTKPVRTNIKDQQVLKDWADYKVGAWKPKPTDLNVLIRDVRAVGKKHGVDFTTGNDKQHVERAAGLLDQLGGQNKDITEGGFARLPGLPQQNPKGKLPKGVANKAASSSKKANAGQPLVPEQVPPTAQKGLLPTETQPIPGQGVDNAFAQATGQNGKLGLAQEGSQSRLLDRTSSKNRGFIDTVMNDPNTDPKIKDSISSLYKSRNTKDLQTKAANLVKDRPDIAETMAFNAKDDTSVAVAAELIKSLQKSGNYESAISLTEKLAVDLTEAGRTVQAATIYGKLTPEGVLRFAQREINKFNEATGSNIKLNPTQAQKLNKLAQDIEKLPEGYDKQVATAKLVAEIQKTIPATVAERLSTLQTMAQLLNPKTNIRNIGGNTIFAGLENISQTVATPVDKLLALVTGQRTTAIPSISTQAKSGVKGLKRGISEAKQGINTGPTTQYELNSVPVFRGKILGALEKTMNGTLRGADRAAYTAAFDDTIKGLLKANKTKTVTPAMIEQAHQTGLYRTFQDTNAISEFFVGIKRSLNKVGIGTEGKRFGLGDLVLKYPKTPANLLARGIDYSPAGFLKAVFSATKPLIGKEFNQKEFVDNFSRAVVGSSAAFGVGYAMAQNGIITAQPEKNKDLRNLQKTEGLGGYQINVSALKRWVTSGFNKDAAKLRPGDTLTSYDWAQPIAIPISAGAALGTNKPTKAGAESVNTIAESANTLAEQPLLQGVQRLFNSTTSLPENVVSTVQSAPASFLPTAVNQINQLIDNTPRMTAPSKGGVPGFIEGAANQVKAKVPIAAQTLPKQVDVLGRDKERYQNGTNNPFNVLLNPAFVNKYEPNQTAKTSMDLYNQTGETKQLPNTVKPTVVINGKKTNLTGQQQSDYQRYVGETNTAITNALSVNERFKGLTPPQQVNLLSSIQTDINAAAKVKLFGDKPKKITTSAQSILDGNSADVINSKLDGAEKAAKPKTPKVKVSKAKKGRKVKVGRGRKGKKISPIKFRIPSAPRVKAPPKVRVAKSKAKFKVATAGKKPKKIKLA